MANYISSNQNRFYTALESSYGNATGVSSSNRFNSLGLNIQQVQEQPVRKDKTGSRSSLPPPLVARKATQFTMAAYLTSWNGASQPSYGPLFQAAMGASPVISQGLVVASVSNPTTFGSVSPHGLSPGAGVSFNNEIRFLAAVPDPSTLQLNAPFSTALQSGVTLAQSVTYCLSTALPSVTIYDYWDPTTSVSRVLVGAAVNSVEFSVNGDFHEFLFSGPAADVIDSVSFTAGQAGLSLFPIEPQLGSFDYSIVPGSLGQVWLGTPASQFFTLTQCKILVENGIETRNMEFGSVLPRAIAPGPRTVSAGFSLFEQDDAQTGALYEAARSRQMTPAMIQLGQQQGELLGIYLPNVQPEVPVFDGSDTRLQWRFQACRAHGTVDDELYVAFA
jgi:hypothetical protein